jgi:hypothetical protein
MCGIPNGVDGPASIGFAAPSLGLPPAPLIFPPAPVAIPPVPLTLPPAPDAPANARIRSALHATEAASIAISNAFLVALKARQA